jgi:hypothetical protein
MNEMFRIAVMWLATLFLATLALSAQQKEGIKEGVSPDGIKPLPSIKVTAPTDVKDVAALNDTLEALSKKVTACVGGGGKPESCRCSYPQELTALRKGYDSLLKQHPAWKDQLLSYQYVNPEGRNISGTLVMQNLRRQLEALKCE